MMKIKILSMVIVLAFLLASYGAVGTNTVVNDCGCRESSNNNSERVVDFSEYPTGLVEPDDWWVDAPFDPCDGNTRLPSKFDWRQEGGCTSIKDQGSCGSCWAFATVAPLECNIKIKTEKEFDLSEQWLVSCNQETIPRKWGCSGGWWAHEYFLEDGKTDPCGDSGAVLESHFPYQAEDVNCECSHEHVCFIDDWSYIGDAQGVPSVSQIKNAIYDYGPVTVALRAGPAFKAYSGGVFNTAESGKVNHGVVLVGWDDNIGGGVWILRNSWGTGWGEDGYMRIKYGTSDVGYAANYIEFSKFGKLSAPGEMSLGPGKPGNTVKGSFTLEYVGVESITWEIDDYGLSEWGEWTFTPSSRKINNNQEQVINVELRIKESHGDGDHGILLKIQNADDISMYCHKDVKIHIRNDRSTSRTLLFRIFENFPFLKMLFDL